MFVFLTRRAQAGGHTDRTERDVLWLPDWQEVKTSVSVFKPEPITGLRCGRRPFLLIPKSVTPSHKTIRGLRGLAKQASRKWSLVAGIVRRMKGETGTVYLK